MSDPAEDIAEAVAAYLSDTARQFGLVAEVTVPENLWAELQAEDKRLRVLVGPAGESEEKENRSQVMVRPEVDVLVVGPVGSPGDRRKRSDYVHEIRESLRFQPMGSPRWVWTKTETVEKYHVDALKLGVFLASFRLTYAGIV